MDLKIEGKKLTQDNFRELINPKRLSKSQMLSLIAQAKRIQKFYAQVEGMLKESFVSMFDEDEFEFENEDWTATRVMQTRTTLSKDLVLEDMGQEWVEEHSTTTEFFVLNVREKKGE